SVRGVETLKTHFAHAEGRANRESRPASHASSRSSPPAICSRPAAYDIRTKPSQPKAEPGTKFTGAPPRNAAPATKFAWAVSRQAAQKLSESRTVRSPIGLPK